MPAIARSGTIITATPGHSRKTMAVGDSITHGDPANVGGYRLPLFVANPGISWVGQLFASGYNEGWAGYTIQQISDQVLPIVDYFAPSMILLIAGTNDLAAGTAAATIYGSLVTFATALKAKASVTNVLVGTVPFFNPNHALEATYNALILGTPHIATGIDAYDISGSLAFPGDFEPLANTHPNTAGYAKMAVAWNAPVSALL